MAARILPTHLCVSCKQPRVKDWTHIPHQGFVCYSCMYKGGDAAAVKVQKVVRGRASTNS